MFHNLCCAMLYLHCITVWLIVVNKAHLRRRYTRWMRCDLISMTRDPFDVIKGYRHLQVMDRWLNVIYGHFLMSVHLGGILGISIATNYMIIRWHDRLNRATIMVALIGICVCFVTMWVGSDLYCWFCFLSCTKYNLACRDFRFVEVKLTATVAELSETFIRNSSSKHRRKSIKGKMTKSLWLINFQTGEPFFHLKHTSFLGFISLLLNFLSTLLIATE